MAVDSQDFLWPQSPWILVCSKQMSSPKDNQEIIKHVVGHVNVISQTFNWCATLLGFTQVRPIIFTAYKDNNKV